MKKKHFLLISTVLLFLIGANFANALSIDLNLSQSPITEGDLFSIDVAVQDAFDGILLDIVVAFGFDVVISDATVVSFLSANVAAPFTDRSSSIPGVDVAGITFSGITPPQNDFYLATLNFQALSVGDVVLGISSMNMTDLNEGLVYVFSGNADITTSVALSSYPVPEPTTFILVSSGIAAFIAFGRQRLKKYGHNEKTGNYSWKKML